MIATAGSRELGNQLEGGIGIAIVVVGQLLALKLPRGRHPQAPVAGAVEGRRLVRVLAIAQLLRQPPCQNCRVGKRGPFLARHPLGDCGVIGRRQGIGLARQGLPHRYADRSALGRDLGEHRVVIGGVGYNRHEIAVLRGGADQRHPANIDALNTILGAGSRGDRLGKRIEVADDEVDRRDPPFGEYRKIVRPVAPRQEARMDRRMKRLHPAVEHLGEAGNRRHLGDRQPGCRKDTRRPAGRDQGDAARCQRSGKRDDPGLVGDGNERALDLVQGRGHRRGILVEGSGV